MPEYREGQIIALLDAHRTPAGTLFEWVVEGATVRIVSLPPTPPLDSPARQDR